MSKTSNHSYPSTEDVKSSDDKLEKLEKIRTEMGDLGVTASKELITKIEETSSQTRDSLPKWVTEPKWIEELEDLKQSLQKAVQDLGDKKGAKKQIESLKTQLAKINKVLDQPKEYLGDMSKKEYAQTVNSETEEERSLTPEEKERTLQTFESSFKKHMHMHEEAEWKDVKASLEAKPEALWSIAQMEAAGHSPDVYDDDDKTWYIGTCSEETPAPSREPRKA